MKTRDQMSPAELKAAMEAYRKRNDAEEVRLRGGAGVADVMPTMNQIPLEQVGMMSAGTSPKKAPKNPEEEVLDEVLVNEGGYQNDPEDKKGNTNSKGQLVGTNRGISAPVYEEEIGRPPTKEDMQAITEEEAKRIYRKKYISPVKEKLKIEPEHPAFSLIVDMFVKDGQGAAAAIIQRVIGAKVDGKIGPETRKKIKAMPTVELTNKLVEERIKYYDRRVKEDPGKAKFLEGWVNRAARYRLAPEEGQVEDPRSTALQTSLAKKTDEALKLGATPEMVLQSTRNHPAVVRRLKQIGAI